MRVAFVGDPLRFGAWVMAEPARGVAPRLIDPADRAALTAFRPDVVVVLDVDAVPAEAYADLGARVIGVAVSTGAAPAGLPSRRPAPPSPRAVRERAAARGPVLLARLLDLLIRTVARRRRPPMRLEEAEARVVATIERRAPAAAQAAPGPPWDRLVALDPQAARGRDLWRLIPPPVDDRLFARPQRPTAPPRVLVAQPSTGHREALLTAAKHAHDLRHIAHGITPQTLGPTLRGADVAVAIGEEPGGRFEHAVALHLAAGHLVITDALTPAHGLEPGIDVLHAGDERQVAEAVGAAKASADGHFAVRVRGHMKAERFRASVVWPRLVGDLLDERAA